MGIQDVRLGIAVQSSGSGDDQWNTLIDQLRQSEKQIDALSGRADRFNQHPGFSGFAEKVKSGIQDPLGAIGGFAESALNKLGPLGAGVAAAGATVAAFGAAGYEAAKSLGNFGDEIGDMGVRMGLTNKEVGEFRFAMKYAGGDMGTLQGIMRKLSQEIEEGGQNLKAMGVTVRDASTNEVRPMSDIILQVSERLNGMTNTAERNTAAVKVLGKAALEVLPDLLELGEGVTRARERMEGFTDDQVARWSGLQKQIAEVDATIETMTRRLKEPIAMVFSVAIRGATGENSDIAQVIAKALQEQIGKLSPEEVQRRLDAAGASGFLSKERISKIQAEIQKQRDIEVSKAAQGKSVFESPFGLSVDTSALSPLAGISVDVSAIGERLKAALAPLKNADLAEATRKLEESQKKLKADPNNTALITEVEQNKAAVLAIEKRTEATKKLEEAVKALQGALQSAEKQARGEYNQAIAGDDPFAKILLKRQTASEGLVDLVKQINQTGGSPELRGRAEAAFREQMKALDIEWDEALKKWRDKVLDFADDVGDVLGKVREQVEKAGKMSGVTDEHGNLRLPPILAPKPADYLSPEGRVEAVHNLYDYELRIAELHTGPGGELDTVEKTTTLRLRAAMDEFKITGDTEKLRLETSRVLLDRQAQIAQLQRQQLEDARQVGGELYDALRQGSKGLERFFTDFMQGELRKVFSAEFADLMGGGLPHLGLKGKSWQGTIFGKDPREELEKAVGKDPLKDVAALKLSGAGDKLDMTAVNLMEAARVLATAPGSGGGQNFSAWTGTAAGILPGESGGIPTDIYSGEQGELASMQAATAKGGFSLGKGIALGGLALGGGLGVYSGIRQGGGKGAASAASSAAMLTGAILSLLSKSLKLAGPIGEIAGMGLSLLTGFLPDPKAAREQQMEERLAAARYLAPTSTAYAVDRYGRSFDSDISGNIRPIQVNISTMDVKSFVDNRHMLVTALDTVLTGKESPQLASSLRNVIARR